MLFASTRSTLTRELGSEKFTGSIFATEAEEVTGPDAWTGQDGAGGESGGDAGYRREDLMGEKERELDAVRRAEDEARSGTRGRDVGMNSNGGGGSGLSGALKSPVGEGVRESLKGIGEKGLVQLVCLSKVFSCLLRYGTCGLVNTFFELVYAKLV